MSYVDGFVVPVPKKNVKQYLSIAKKAGKVWKDHGALDYCEGVRLSFDGNRFTDVALLRLSGDTPIDERIRVTPG